MRHRQQIRQQDQQQDQRQHDLGNEPERRWQRQQADDPVNHAEHDQHDEQGDEDLDQGPPSGLTGCCGIGAIRVVAV